ncbi:MAG: hypothetical protein R3D28_08250 [Geminicoccaceae bacterium]
MEQPGPAPLVFVIAGTGGGFNADINQSLARILYAAGFHVIGLPNPTPIRTSPSTPRPPACRVVSRTTPSTFTGRCRRPTRWSRTGSRSPASNLTGYSLGATYSAFLAELDLREKVFNFNRVLLLNPAVSVFASVGLVDGMLLTDTPEERNNVREFINTVLTAFGRLYRGGEPVDFSGDFHLPRTYTELDLSATEIEKLIGVAFRLSANTMAFTSDVLAETGVIVPKGTILTRDHAAGTLLPALAGVQLHALLRGNLHAVLRRRGAGPRSGADDRRRRSRRDRALSRQRQQCRRHHQRRRPDPAAADFAFLERVFDDRLVIYPIGGHCGNYRQRDVAARIQDYFRAAELGQ